MKGEPITGPVPELRIFGLCQNMKWAHLPNAGGIYDQDPELMDKFQFIFQRIAEHERAEAKKREEEINKTSKKMGGSSGRAAPRSTRIRNR